VITYLKGDATAPQGDGPKIIPHVVNTLGGWGAGFVLAVSNRWPGPESAYRQWHREKAHKDVCGDDKRFVLGSVQVLQVKPDIWVANMLAQQGMGRSGPKGPPLHYFSLSKCLEWVALCALEKKATVHMPRIGTGLAGGRWDIIEPLISESLCGRGVGVFVYDLV